MEEKIKSEARKLLDKFGMDLKNIKILDIPRSSGKLRNEEKGINCDISFKTIMFKNVKHKNESYLLLEKSHWN